MTPIPKKPYDEMTPAEYQEWCREIARWYYAVIDDIGTGPGAWGSPKPGGSVPTVIRRPYFPC